MKTLKFLFCLLPIILMATNISAKDTGDKTLSNNKKVNAEERTAPDECNNPVNKLIFSNYTNEKQHISKYFSKIIEKKDIFLILPKEDAANDSETTKNK